MLFKKVKELNIDTIVVGYNEGWKQKVNIGKKNNQNFVQIPFNKLMSAIENKCLKEGIRFVKQEESYTSKARFLDQDELPVWCVDDKRTIYSAENGSTVGNINVCRGDVFTRILMVR